MINELVSQIHFNRFLSSPAFVVSDYDLRWPRNISKQLTRICVGCFRAG